MNRITLRQPIAEALDLLPDGIRRRVAHAHFLTGVDPVFVGLHTYKTFRYDGREWSYAQNAHVAWRMNQRARADRVTTVVLPVTLRPAQAIATIVHELGHVLDEQIGFDRHTPEPVSAYARTNSYEAFAEAFEAWVVPELAADKDLAVLAGDEQTRRLFEELAR